MKKATPRKLEVKTQTIAELTQKDLETVAGGGRSKTGNCPIMKTW